MCKAVIDRSPSINAVCLLYTSWPSVRVRPGLYHVTFGADVWKSVEVSSGKTTVLEPGVLEIRPAGWRGHRVLETETGKVLAELTGAKNRATLVPARVAVTFGDLVWPDVEVKPGAVTTLKPVSYTHLDVYKRQVHPQGRQSRRFGSDCRQRGNLRGLER